MSGRVKRRFLKGAAMWPQNSPCAQFQVGTGKNPMLSVPNALAAPLIGETTAGHGTNQQNPLAVQRQVTAMAADLFEIGLYNPDAGLTESAMIPRVWTLRRS